MTLSLKDQNKLPLVAIALGNIAVFILLIHGDLAQITDWGSIATSLRRSVPAGLALIVVGIVNAQLSADMKARIVFGRWRHPLPASEAFSRYARSDDRIDCATLERLFGPFPSSPKEQSALWYRLYKSVDTDHSVNQVHREYLFTRDYTCIALMLVLAFGPLGVIKIVPLTTAITYWALLAIQFVLVALAARNHGRRFVTTVLALKSAGK